MNLESLFEDFFDNLPSFPVRDTRALSPKPNGKPQEPVHPAVTEGGCHIEHQMVEIGRRQEFVDFANKNGVVMRGCREWVVCRCLRCGKEERFMPLNVQEEEN